MLSSFYLYQILERRLPENINRSLFQFAKEAVYYTEQVCLKADSAAKKRYAINVVYDLFHEFKLPIPSEIAIDIAIESALVQMKSLAIINDDNITLYDIPVVRKEQEK
jgi:hypothetical protein